MDGSRMEDCGWKIIDAARVIDSYDIHATIEKMAKMQPEELRERFATGLRKEAENKRKMAASATKNMLKWRRWHRILSTMINQSVV